MYFFFNCLIFVAIFETMQSNEVKVETGGLH